MAGKRATADAGERFTVPRHDPGVLAELDELLVDKPGLRAGKMFGCPGYFLGAKAVACVFGGEICLTLPRERVEALVREPGCRPFVARGRAMTGWTLVQPERLRALAESTGILDEAIAYARAKALAPADGKKPPGTNARRATKAPSAARKPQPVKPAASDVFRKLNWKGQPAVILNPPDSFQPELAALEPVDVRHTLQGPISFLLAFVTRQNEVDVVARGVARKAEGDAVIWFAYPKGTSKRYRCEFNRDTGWAALGAAGFEPVRQIAIDEDWSALRFRRVEHIKTMKRDPKRALTSRGRARTQR